MNFTDPIVMAALMAGSLGCCLFVVAVIVAMWDKKRKRKTNKKRQQIDVEAKLFAEKSKETSLKIQEKISKKSENTEVNDSLRVLGFNDNQKPNKEEIMNSWRRVMKKTHPDITGRELGRVKMTEATKARDIILKNLNIKP